MRLPLVLAVTVLVFSGCASGPSLDQQQQSWEAEVRERSCEGIQKFDPGDLEFRWALDELAKRSGSVEAMRTATFGSDRVRPYNCSEPAFERYYGEQLERQFADSPKGMAGETTAPQPPR